MKAESSISFGQGEEEQTAAEIRKEPEGFFIDLNADGQVEFVSNGNIMTFAGKKRSFLFTN